MPLAYLVTGHRLPRQMARLTKRLAHHDDLILVHIDRKVDASPFTRAMAPLLADDRLTFVEPRVRCHWSSFGVVEATLRGARMALRSGHPFTHLVLLTGQDYPVKRLRTIRRFLDERRRQTFMSWSAGGDKHLPDEERIGNPSWCWNGDTWRLDSRYYWIAGRKVAVPNRFLRFPRVHKRPPSLPPLRMGLAYAALSRAGLEWVLAFVRERPEVLRYFKRVLVPDEFFFQTLLLSSPLADQVVNQDLHWLIWDGWHPKVLGEEDVASMIRSPKLFARKFDMDQSPVALDLLDQELGYVGVPR